QDAPRQRRWATAILGRALGRDKRALATSEFGFLKINAKLDVWMDWMEKSSTRAVVWEGSTGSSRYRNGIMALVGDMNSKGKLTDAGTIGSAIELLTREYEYFTYLLGPGILYSSTQINPSKRWLSSRPLSRGQKTKKSTTPTHGQVSSTRGNDYRYL